MTVTDAACAGVDVDVFVVIGGGTARNQSRANRAKLANALTYCRHCPVIAECAAYMQTWDTPPRDIVIAGMTPKEAWQAWHTAHGTPTGEQHENGLHRRQTLLLA